MVVESGLPFTVLVSDSRTPCGVETFARRLAAEAGARASTLVLKASTFRSLARGRDAPAIVVNLPMVAWKRRFLEPIMAVFAARAHRSKIILILHEWADLDWRRRASYVPLIMAADVILFSCPEVEERFPFWLGNRNLARAIVPIPPSFSTPPVTRKGPTNTAIAQARRENRFVIGHFGSIYPKKNPKMILDIAAAVMARGVDPFVVFVGSFIQGRDRVQEDFEDHVRRMGLTGKVLVTGFIESAEELYAAFEDIGLFVYAFAGGLTTRRSSVLACLSAGAAVVANAPQDAASFEDHPVYRQLLASEQLRLVPTDADAGQIADALIATRSTPFRREKVDVDAAWAASLRAVDAAVRG